MIITVTDRQKVDLQQAETSILQATGLNQEQWLSLMFHIGSLFAEDFSRLFLNREDLRNNLLTNPTYGFWAWFKLKWAMDDAAILNLPATAKKVAQGDYYQDLKHSLIGDNLYVKELYHIIAPLIP